MKYISTRNINNFADSRSAVLQGLAKDGGLFVPEQIPAMDFGETELLSFSYNELCTDILNLMLPDFGEQVIEQCVNDGYAGKFDVPEKVEVKKVGKAAFLELYHGPTSAFKDMALCILPRLLTAAGKALGSTDCIHILTATSGDTGKAALEAFSDVPGTSVTVFYPVEGVSAVQKLQMQTQEGSNVRVCAVEGNFDDAQSGVKKAFSEINIPGTSLCSANSINIGRLVPQITYYFWAYACMVKNGSLKYGESLDFSVPTGNFGDILAGWLAKRMGLPVGTLLCASNENNVLTDFIKTGVYDRRRAFFTTTSPSMDILISSNLERLLFYACGNDDKELCGYMNELAGKGCYAVSQDVLARIQKDFTAEYADSREGAEAIKELWSKAGYLMDTHTAVAYACAKKAFTDRPFVVLSTASPYKFAPAVLEAIGEEVPEDCFKAMEKLEAVSGITQPPRLAGLRSKDILHKDVIKPAALTQYVETIIRENR